MPTRLEIPNLIESLYLMAQGKKPEHETETKKTDIKEEQKWDYCKKQK